MVKIPKKLNKVCPYCHKKTEAKLILAKSGGKRGTLTAGQRRHQRRAGVSGYGGSPQPKAAARAKTSKKTNIRFKCADCGKQWVVNKNIRAKKLTQKQ